MFDAEKPECEVDLHRHRFNKLMLGTAAAWAAMELVKKGYDLALKLYRSRHANPLA